MTIKAFDMVEDVDGNRYNVKASGNTLRAYLVKGGAETGLSYQIDPKPVEGFAPTFKKVDRYLSTIAEEIIADWSNCQVTISAAAKPYLSAMRSLSTLNDFYGMDKASSVVRYFLANAGTWRGQTARRIKAELNLMLKKA